MSELTGQQAFRALQRQAREQGRGTEELLVLYAHEGFLRRLSMSKYRNTMVLKGGLLLAALDARRPTRDADLAARGIANDDTSVRNAVATIAGVAAADGVTFDPNNIATNAMRDEADYHGVRVTIPAAVSTARIKVQVDLSFGDPVSAREITYPALLADTDINLLGYPIELVLAEKIATMISRGATNTRDRDFADVALLSRLHHIDGGALGEALARTAAHRGHAVISLRSALADHGTRRHSTWTALRARAGLDALPADFDAIVEEVLRFADPLIEATDREALAWTPDTRRWSRIG